MHQDDYILGHNEFLLHPSAAIIIINITIIIIIIIILPYVNSTQLQQVTHSNMKQVPYLPQCKMILI
jgi:hypothetical protein